MVQALSGVDLDVVQGKVVGLVGANGAGKSTLLKIIAGALPSDSGGLRLDGEPLVMTSITHAAQAGIAIVSQELSLFPALSVEENLLLAPGGRDWKSRRVFARRAREIFAKLGANVALSAPLHRLALADRQLIEIARALLQNPRVLILDEPTVGIDVGARQDIYGLIQQFRRETEHAVILVTSDIDEVLEIADRILVLADYRVVTELDPARTDKQQILEYCARRVVPPTF